MKVLSKNAAIAELQKVKRKFVTQIANEYEHRAKNCLTCDTRGACCLDAHFVNVHITRLEAATSNEVIHGLPQAKQTEVRDRIASAIETYNLSAEEDTSGQTFACPLFEKDIGCLVHRGGGKPLACIHHGCYEQIEDLPPDELLEAAMRQVERLVEKTYAKPASWLPLPIALMKSD
ncbi:MAG: hypothetical protein ABR535_02785 [Pyrinomonadaceae bacterium]